MQKIQIPPWIIEILDRLELAGFEAFVVGGCVRDSLLHALPKDWDITTNATPQEIKALFAGYCLYTLGEKYGTIGVLSPMSAKTVEITTYRSECGYTDLRHPNAVHFISSLQEDLSRRDFSINAIAYHHKRGFIDPYGGIADIAKRRIICVGDAFSRFSEDALRVLRALRFQSRLNFSIHSSTLEAIWRHYPLLEHIARERIIAEMYEILRGDFSLEVLMQFWSVFQRVLGADTSASLKDIGEAGLAFWRQSSVEIRLSYVLSSLFSDAVCLEKFLKDFKFSNRDGEKMRFCYAHRMCQNPSKVTIKRLLSKSSLQNVEGLLDFLELYTQVSHKENKALLQAILQNNECFSLKQLAINGNTLQKMGITHGKLIGEILQKLLEEVILEALPNTEECLKQHAFSLIN